jgi:hypothetical protein
MLWPNAQEQGSIAGANAVGGKKLYRGSYSFVTVNLFDTFMFSWGSTSKSTPGSIYKEKESGKGYNPNYYSRKPIRWSSNRWRTPLGWYERFHFQSK